MSRHLSELLDDLKGRVARMGAMVQQVVEQAVEGQGRPFEPRGDLTMMGTRVVATLRDTIKAFNQSDADLARHVLRGDDVVDALYHQIVQDMLAQVEDDGHKAAAHLAYIMIA